MFLDWISNKRPPWAAYWSFMSGYLIALDKITGVRQVGIRENWSLLFSKCMLKVMAPEGMQV